MNKSFPSFSALCFLALCLSPCQSHAQIGCVDSSLINPNAVCITLFDPVCGCNGVTYGNSCEALNHGGVTSWVTGVCQGNVCTNLDPGFVALLVFQSPVVSFSDQSSFPNGQIIAWVWDFGDGANSNEQNPTHTFSAAGNYVVYLTVRALNANGLICQGTFCRTINVTADCFDNCFYDFEYELNGTALHAELDIIDPPFFFNVVWSLDDSPFSGSGLEFAHLFDVPGIHTLCATYPTGDFTAETCTVCKAIEVTALCVEPSQIDSAPCPLVFIPVCGCDGKTYGNACEAYHWGGVTSWVPGICGSVCNNLLVDFEGANTGGTLTVWTFIDQSVFPGGTINSWFWSFGNGETSTDESPTINFLDPGDYEVCLTASGIFADSTPCSGSFCQTITVASQLCVDPNVINLNIQCPAIYAPVCGCDGVTYENECVAYNHHGVTDWTPGICPDLCFNPAWVDSTGACLGIYDPVCGCDGNDYPNYCYAINYGGVASWTKGVCCEMTNAAPEPAAKLFDLEIMPNPAHEQAQVRVSGASPREATLFDVFGKKVWEKSLSSPAFEIGTGELPAGIYLLQVLTEKGAGVRKLVVTQK